MKLTSTGRPLCSPTDLAVLRGLSLWQELPESIFFEDLPIPQIPSAQVFVLLFYNPGSYGSYLHTLTELMKISNHSSDYYRCRDLVSPSGKVRRIEAPQALLLGIQRWILKNILSQLPLSDAACAYRKGRSLRDNAAPHIGKKQLVKLDISHFFESISFGRVYGIFREIGYSMAVSTLLGKLCTLRGHLPQGAPSSPAIANIVLTSFDEAVLDYCKERGICYTRYSDDLTFSADQMDAKALIRFVRAELSKAGFLVNKQKIRVLGSGARHKVCGLVVNDTLSVPSSYRRKLRQEMYYLTRYPLHDHLLRLNDPRYIEIDGSYRCEFYLRNLLGRVQFVNQISPSDEFRSYASTLKEMLFALEEYPEHPSRCGYLLGGEEALREEVMAIVANSTRGTEPILGLLIPDSAKVLERLLEEGLLISDEETGRPKVADTQTMFRLQEPEMQLYSYERALRMLASPSTEEAKADLLSDYLFQMARGSDFPYERLSTLNKALTPWIRRSCRRLWDDQLSPDTEALPDRVYTAAEAAVLCTMSFLPEGVSERFSCALFANVSDALETLIEEGRIHWLKTEKGPFLHMTPEAFLSFFQNKHFPWSWNTLEPVFRNITETSTANFQPAPSAQIQILRILNHLRLATGTPKYALPAIRHLSSFTRMILFHYAKERMH